MKLRDIIENLDRSENNSAYSFDMLMEELDIIDYRYPETEEELDVKSYWIAPKRCTDSFVGISAWFYKDELFAIGTQKGRKYNIDFMFLQKEIFLKVYEYLKSFENSKKFEFHDVEKLLDADMGEGYELSYTDQLVGNRIIYEGTECPVNRSGATSYTFKLEGFAHEILVENILVPYRLKKG